MYSIALYRLNEMFLALSTCRSTLLDAARGRCQHQWHQQLLATLEQWGETWQEPFTDHRQHHLSFCPQYLIPEDNSASVCLKGQKGNTCSSCINHTSRHSSRPWQPWTFLMLCTQQMNPHLTAQHPAEHQRANCYSSHYSIFSSSRCPLRPHCHNHNIW